SGTVWIPIARIPISGITAGTPVMLVKQLPPMSQLWDSVTLPFGKSNGNGGIYPIGKIPNPNAIKALNGRAILSSGTTVAIPFIHPSYLQRSVQVSIAPDGTVNLLVGPEVAVTGGIVEIHF
ncbi:hypothetical protein, partial [Bifidobacterium adolescentis]